MQDEQQQQQIFNDTFIIMMNKRENSSIQPSRRPDFNGDKTESTRPTNLLVKKNNVAKRDQLENRHHHDSIKFNDAGAPASDNDNDASMPVQGHACTRNEGRVEENGRERLKRHRVEVAGRVWIPEIWGQEELLKDWIDCSAFDAKLMNNNNIMSAKAALVEETRRSNSTCRLTIENSC
ncbi:hypothetical protein HAX54_045902 [Datura stramonium]|uniref:Protein BIC1-like n=1 Tax=Datura stramonium TaxID=4076 RepID=A0ABS8SQY8_DATST|nr:hypothetical protein [Datura stramonium]